MRLIRLFCLQIHGVLRKDIPTQSMNIGLTMIRFNYWNNVLQKAQISFLISRRLVLLYLNIEKKTEINLISVFNSPSWVRTNDPSVNSRMLYHWAIEEYLYSINPFVSFDKGFYLLFYFYIPSKLHTRNISFSSYLSPCLVMPSTD